jgi:hypothetical protein
MRNFKLLKALGVFISSGGTLALATTEGETTT